MNRVDATSRLWIAGAVLALAGGAVARWFAPELAGNTQALVRTAALATVILGLFLAALATGRRARARAADYIVAEEPETAERSAPAATALREVRRARQLDAANR